MMSSFDTVRSPEEQRIYCEKQRALHATHPDRMPGSRPESFVGTAKEYAIEFIKESFSKGYTIIRADDPLHQPRSRYGVVVYKEIEGVELAYNPTWGVDLGRLDDETVKAYNIY